uniref:Uncharacterized protein n=1 Tax=Rhizophora mucronata TaxID=61149 RepID=A0A2P2P6M4_RHIMU
MIKPFSFSFSTMLEILIAGFCFFLNCLDQSLLCYFLFPCFCKLFR